LYIFFNPWRFTSNIFTETKAEFSDYLVNTNKAKPIQRRQVENFIELHPYKYSNAVVASLPPPEGCGGWSRLAEGDSLALKQARASSPA
jgi:hypothetical protein